MANNKEYRMEPIDFGGKKIEALFEAMPGEAEGVLRDMVESDPPRIGLAQAAALHVALTEVRADGERIFKNSTRGAQRARNSVSGINTLPPTREYYDREKKESLVRRLLKEVVREEFWLSDMFPEAFEEFVEDDAPANPTADPSVRNIPRKDENRAS